MPEQEQIERRKATGTIVAGALIGAAGTAAGLFTEAADLKGHVRPNKSTIDAFFKPDKIRKLQKNAIRLADHVITPKPEEQGLALKPFKPEINATLVAETALLLAGLVGGDQGVTTIADSLQKKGLEIRFVNSPPTQHKKEKDPYVITLPEDMKVADLEYKGVAAKLNTTDFDLLNQINQYVISESAPSVSPVRTHALLTDAGIVLGAAFMAEGVAETVTRRRFMGRAAAAVTGVAGILVAEKTNIGGKVQNGINGLIQGGVSLGADYDHLNSQYKPFITSPYFQQRIKGNLIKQRPVATHR